MIIFYNQIVFKTLFNLIEKYIFNIFSKKYYCYTTHYIILIYNYSNEEKSIKDKRQLNRIYN